MESWALRYLLPVYIPIAAISIPGKAKIGTKRTADIKATTVEKLVVCRYSSIRVNPSSIDAMSRVIL